MNLRRVVLGVISALIILNMIVLIITSLKYNLEGMVLLELTMIILLLLALIASVIDLNMFRSKSSASKKTVKKKDEDEKGNEENEEGISSDNAFSRFLKENLGAETAKEFDTFRNERDRYTAADFETERQRFENDLRENIGVEGEFSAPEEREAFEKKVKDSIHVEDSYLDEEDSGIKADKYDNAYDDVDKFIPRKNKAKIVGDRNKKMFHKETCSDIMDIDLEDMEDFDSISEAILKGYSYCKKCVK